MKLSAQFDLSKVDHTKDNVVHLLLTTEAPAIDWLEKRPRVFILPVVDISGSMVGNKLSYAKQACKKLVEQLQPGDVAGLVSFSTKARIEVEPSEVTPALKLVLSKAIDRLHTEGGTNFSGAVTESLKAMRNRDLPPSILHRVIFFTDGQPTEGITDPIIIKGLVEKNLGSFSMSFFGYGSGNDTWGGCDQTLLTDLSQLGRGNYAYVQNPDDALAAFGKELGGLLSTYASDLTLTVEPKNGHTITKIVTDVKHDASDVMGITTFDLENILAEESRHVVVECLLKAQDKAFPRPFTIFEVKATFRKMTPQGLQESEEVTTVARAEFVREADAQQQPAPEVDGIVALHRMAQIQKAAEAEADKGNYASAQGLLRSFANEAHTKGYVEIAEASVSLQDDFLNIDQYRKSEGMRKSLHRGAMRGAAVSSYDPQAAAILANCKVELSNSAQTSYAASFANDATSPPPVAPVVVPATPRATLLVPKSTNE